MIRERSRPAGLHHQLRGPWDSRRLPVIVAPPIRAAHRPVFVAPPVGVLVRRPVHVPPPIRCQARPVCSSARPIAVAVVEATVRTFEAASIGVTPLVVGCTSAASLYPIMQVGYHDIPGYPPRMPRMSVVLSPTILPSPTEIPEDHHRAPSCDSRGSSSSEDTVILAVERSPPTCILGALSPSDEIPVPTEQPDPIPRHAGRSSSPADDIPVPFVQLV